MSDSNCLCEQNEVPEDYGASVTRESSSVTWKPEAGQEETRPSNFEEAYADAIDKMVAIHDAKRNDYTGGNTDPLANYRASAAIINREAHHIMLARIQEKVNRVGVLFGDTEQQVADEKVTDTLLDIANIALLILAELESR